MPFKFYRRPGGEPTRADDPREADTVLWDFWPASNSDPAEHAVRTAGKDEQGRWRFPADSGTVAPLMLGLRA